MQANVSSPLWDLETDDVNVRISQLQILTSGYRKLAETSPDLPSVDSRLPSLISGRVVEQIISGTREGIQATLKSLREARRDLQNELNSLTDSETLNKIFKRRVGELEIAASQTNRDDSHTMAVRLMDSEKLQTRTYQQDREVLNTALDEFITDRLSPLLAAEELGGPVTGSVLNVTDDMLAAGFTDRGKVNKGRKADDDHRQRRIDEMFGNLAVRAGDDQDDLAAEAAIAAQAMKDLLEKLIQLSIDRGSGRFLELDKEDAASRYLVRSKVAVLDPRDGRKIRLVDFGKPLEDWL